MKPRIVVRLILIAAVVATTVVAQRAVSRRFRRAQTPDWSSSPANNVFFDNAFTQALKGDRPENLSAQPMVASVTSDAAAQPTEQPSGQGWSRYISGETIEDTIKLLRSDLEKSVVQPAQFAGGGNRAARRQFVLLATLFAIIEQYDGDVRWKDQAVAAREKFRASAQTAKVGSIQAFNAAKFAKADLIDLIGGNTLSQVSADPVTDWSMVADRNILMQQLETILEDELQPNTNNPNDFKQNTSLLRRNAEYMAALAEVLTLEDMEDATDDDYVEFSRRIQSASSSLLNAINDGNAVDARKATGEINKACSECHEMYRGL
ncbi:MAG: hypothetical protein AAF497_01795 [Planctomycetota bacterium]